MVDPRVFISYSHDSEDHREAVLQLAQQLRGEGVDVHLDRFVTAPDAGWPRWMMAEVDAADFVLLVCTPTYRRRFEGQEAAGKGKGATFEGLLAIQHLYDANTRNNKFIPVVFAGVAETDVPLVLRPYTRYTLPAQFEGLYRHITGQPEVVAAALGPRKILPSRGAAAPPPTTATSPVASAQAPTRTPLAAATVRSEGGRDVHIEPAELLHRLLLSLFSSADQFRQWVSLGPDGHNLVAEFPGGSTSASATSTPTSSPAWSPTTRGVVMTFAGSPTPAASPRTRPQRARTRPLTAEFTSARSAAMCTFRRAGISSRATVSRVAPLQAGPSTFRRPLA